MVVNKQVSYHSKYVDSDFTNGKRPIAMILQKALST